MSPSTFEPWPLDFLILEAIPDTGIIGGVHWNGRRVREIARTLSSSELRVTSPQIQSRMRVLRINGYVKHHPAHGGLVWSRTPKGVELLACKDQVLGL